MFPTKHLNKGIIIHIILSISFRSISSSASPPCPTIATISLAKRCLAYDTKLHPVVKLEF